MSAPYESDAAELCERIVAALTSGDWDGVVARCWDKEEADRVRELLAGRFEGRVQITWTTFQRGDSMTKKSGRLTISRLTVHGVLGVADSTIDLDTITVLAGANATGKSSHLKALRSALGIDRTALARLTRIPDAIDFKGATVVEDLLPGEPSVEVLLVGEDREVSVTRRGSGSPDVRERVGEDWRKVPRPVEWLRELIDVEAANPALWLASDDETRAAAVLAAMPLEGYRRAAALRAAGLESFRLPQLPEGLHPLEDLELIEDAVFSARTEIKRQERAEHDAATKLLAGLPAEAPRDVEGLLAVAVSTAEAQAAILARDEEAEKAAERAATTRVRADHERERTAAATAFELAGAAAREASAEALRVAMNDLRFMRDQEMTAAQAKYEAAQATARNERAEAQTVLEKLRAELALQRERVADLRARQQGAETDRHVRATAAEAEAKAQEHETRAGELSAGIEALRRYRLELAGRLPVKGLAVAFDEKGRKSLTLDGVPLSQVNDGRLVELAVEVSLLRTDGPHTQGHTDGRPFLPLVLLDGIEKLDPAARGALLRDIAARGSQVVAACVTGDAMRALRGEAALAEGE